MRRKEEIIADPQATHEEIEALPLEDRINHPNCHKDVWWYGAVLYPLIALCSPAYGLMTLEDPGRWESLERNEAEDWLQLVIPKMAWDKRQFLAADCLAHAVSWFENLGEDPSTMEEAIEMRRCWARLECTDAKWQRSADKVSFPEGGAHPTLLFLAEACQSPDVCEAVQTIASALSWSAPSGTLNDVKREEQRWQWRRLLSYVLPRQETP